MSNLGADPKWCYLCGRVRNECSHRTYSPPPIQIPGPDDECPSCTTLRASLAAAEKERNFLNEKVVPTLEARAEAAEKDADALAKILRWLHDEQDTTLHDACTHDDSGRKCEALSALAAHAAAKGRR